jgi:protein-disulfide isomerase
MEKLTKKERKELKKLEEQQKQEVWKKQKTTQTISVVIGIIAFVAFAWFLISYAKDQNKLKIPQISAKDVLIGPKNSKVQIVEYADFECPACATYSPTIEKLLNTNKDKVSFVYRFFPLTSIHKNARTSAQVAYASYRQGKFLDMYKMLYKNQDTWANLEIVDTALTDYAKLVGLNISQFKKDYKSKDVVQFVKDSEQQATSLGLFATPTFFINGDLVDPKSPADLEKMVKSKL